MIKFALHGSQGFEDSLRIAGGPGSGWTAEGGHVKGSQTEHDAAEQQSKTAEERSRFADRMKTGGANTSAMAAHYQAARMHERVGNTEKAAAHRTEGDKYGSRKAGTFVRKDIR